MSGVACARCGVELVTWYEADDARWCDPCYKVRRDCMRAIATIRRYDDVCDNADHVVARLEEVAASAGAE